MAHLPLLFFDSAHLCISTQGKDILFFSVSFPFIVWHLSVKYFRYLWSCCQ